MITGTQYLEVTVSVDVANEQELNTLLESIKSKISQIEYVDTVEYADADLEETDDEESDSE